VKEEVPHGRRAAVPLQVVLLGITVFLVISSVSILHTNQYEFIYLRFADLKMVHVSYFDTVLYSAYLVGGIVIGLLTDRWGKRKLFLLIGSAGSVLFFLLMTRSPTYGILLIFRFCQGAFTVAEWQILMTLVLDNSTAENRGRCFGLFGMFLALSMGVGPVFGGIIAGRGVFLPYYIGAALHGLVLLLSVALIQEPPELKKKPGLARSIAVIRERPSLLVPSLFNFIDRLHIGFIIFLLPLYVQMVLGKGPQMRGMILGVHALAFILLQYPVGRLSDRFGRLAFLIPGSLGYGLLLMIAGYVGSKGIGPLALIFFALGVFSGLTGPTNAALVGDLSCQGEHGMAMAIFNFTGNVGIVFGPVLAGWVTDLGDFYASFLVAGGVELLGLGICLLFIKRYFPLSLLHSFQHRSAQRPGTKDPGTDQ
jgi:DHA1 family tetracycline resistance protein-like MFS transporter